MDEKRGLARFHLAPMLSVLVDARVLTADADTRLHRRLPVLAEWFPDPELGGVGLRITFARRDRGQGIELDLAKVRAFATCSEALLSASAAASRLI